MILPDFKVPGSSWPNFAALDPDHWPAIHLDQASASLGPGNSGRGTIVTSGDLTLNGNFQWRGILLVGGALTSNGNQTVEGTTITGLNMLLGQSVGQSSLGNGTKTTTTTPAGCGTRRSSS